MGQKVHPNGFRLGVTNQHSSQWFAKPSQYSKLLSEDTFIRDFLFKKFQDLHKVSIQRNNEALLIHLEASDPSKILPELDNIKKLLGEKLTEGDRQLANGLKSLYPSSMLEGYIHAKSPCKLARPYSIFCTISNAKDISAQSIANSIKEQLEERLPFRKAMKKSLRLAKMRKVKGMKIQISGRLNGAEIARTEWERYGAVSLQTLRSNIDYTECIAHTIYGVLGIKVWVQY